MTTSYDVIGKDYTASRRPDPRIARQIRLALGECASVANVGAGTGSYEPDDRHCVAIEPSMVMIRQRCPGTAPAVQARAESLPIANDAVDAAMAILTIHHWSDPAAGLAEMRRIARRRVVVLTWDQDVWSSFWLLREYFPDCDADARRAVPIADVLAGVGDGQIREIPIPYDCIDGFHGAYWRRPEAYLDARVRAGISTFAEMSAGELEKGLAKLADDLASGAWLHRHRGLMERTELDLGYRLVVSAP